MLLPAGHAIGPDDVGGDDEDGVEAVLPDEGDEGLDEGVEGDDGLDGLEGEDGFDEDGVDGDVDVLVDELLDLRWRDSLLL